MKEIKYRQPKNDLSGFHYWGMINGKWVCAFEYIAGYKHPKHSQQSTGQIDKNDVELGDIFTTPELIGGAK